MIRYYLALCALSAFGAILSVLLSLGADWVSPFAGALLIGALPFFGAMATLALARSGAERGEKG